MDDYVEVLIQYKKLRDLLFAVILGIGLIIGSSFVTMYHIGEINKKLETLASKPIDMSGLTYDQMNDLRLKIYSIERFVRQAPLVECVQPKR